MVPFFPLNWKLVGFWCADWLRFRMLKIVLEKPGSDLKMILCPLKIGMWDALLSRRGIPTVQAA